MIRTAPRFARLAPAMLLVALTGCSQADTTHDGEARLLSDEEALNLLENARVFQPTGEHSVNLREVGEKVAVTCTQPFELRLQPGGPGAGGILACGGSCKLKPGAKFSDCKTSGCLRSGNTCTPLVCSGGCVLDKSCKPEREVSLFAF